MRPVDPRLLKYASAARAFFAVGGVLALVQTAVIVAFSSLVTQLIVQAIAGSPLSSLAPLLAALVGVVVLRFALSWGSEVNSARGAAVVKSELRRRVLDAVTRLGPAWLGARNSTSVGVTVGPGLDALDNYFAKYLPQLVLTAIAMPVLVIVIWSQDWISGLIVAVTLPLIPVFMILIGWATQSVQSKQWEKLGRLSTAFLDVVGGLSTLKIYGRQHRQAARIRSVTDDYRSQTMKVLRVSFLSGFALELAASLSVALVAVSIGVRLIDGSLGLSVGLFVLLLAPEAFLPLRNVGAQFHAAADGVAAADDVFAILDAGARSGADSGSRSGAGSRSRAGADSGSGSGVACPPNAASGAAEGALGGQTSGPVLATDARDVSTTTARPRNAASPVPEAAFGGQALGSVATNARDTPAPAVRPRDAASGSAEGAFGGQVVGSAAAPGAPHSPAPAVRPRDAASGSAEGVFGGQVVGSAAAPDASRTPAPALRPRDAASGSAGGAFGGQVVGSAGATDASRTPTPSVCPRNAGWAGPEGAFGRQAWGGVRGLEVRGLGVRYGESVAFSGVDARFPAGAVTAVTGASGSGKSSLVAALLGFVRATGEILVDGRVVNADPVPRPWLAWAGQGAVLLPGSVASNVALGDPAPDDALSRAALDLVGGGSIALAATVDPRGEGLSGGQAQRVAAARAVYRARRFDCAVVAFDEPTSALDEHTEAAVIRSFRALADEGRTVLVVSHRRAVVEAADHEVVLGAAPVPAGQPVSIAEPVSALSALSAPSALSAVEPESPPSPASPASPAEPVSHTRAAPDSREPRTDTPVVRS